MPTKRKRWPKVLGAVALVLIASYWWLFVQTAEARGDWALNLAEVRQQADAIPGEKPRMIRVERVGQFRFPRAVVQAGDGWGLQPMQIFSYQIVFPDRTAIIDTALTEALPGGSLDREALDRLGKALAKASLIVVTHEHVDHLGGLAAQPNLRELLRVARLNPEQVSHPELLDPARFPPGSLDGYRPLAYTRSVAVAPGVVLIRAPGHTPGSQLVYVQQADGVEFLFLGDVAWDHRNVDSVRGRPRAAALAIKEDRGPVMRQLEQLHELARSEPRLHQVPGHDPGPVDALVAQHLIQEKFQLTSE